MPRSGQIIPKYVQPHEEVYINDNTYYEDIVDNTGGPTFLCVFVGGKGRDKLLLKRSWGAFVEEYGYPNYRRWGQAMYIPYTALYSGNAQAQCLRLVADDSTYANLIFVVGYKRENGKLKLRFKVYTRENLRTIDDLTVFAESLETTTADADGYKYVPFMTFYCLGRGTYGEDFRIRITHDKNADKENDYKNYNVEVLSTEAGSKMIESYNVTFDVEGTDPNTKLTNFVQEIVNDEEGSGSKTIGCEFFVDSYQKLFDEFVEVYKNNGYVAPVPVKVDRLPSITLPSSDVLYHLTKNDGSKAAGGMFVYDADNGVFNASGFTVSELGTKALPEVETASRSVIYRVTNTYQDAVTGDTYQAGDTLITTDNINWTKAPSIIDVEKLPSTTLYEEGVVYELTAEDNGKVAGTQWIYNSIAGDYIAFVDEGPEEVEVPYTLGTFDLFGYNRFTKEDEPLIEIDGGKETLVFMDLEGVGLASGSDGSFADDVDKATREAAMEQAYVNAFQGVTDKRILSKRRAPADLILDAGHSVNVKKAMASMILQRMDMAGRFDTGLLTDVNDVYDMGVALGSINTYMISKDTGMFKTLDPVTGRIIPTTITLWMASQYPLHYLIYGNYVPLAGENYAVLSGYVNHSIKPEIDADDMDIKEKLLTEYQINYVECLDEDTYVRGTQTTSQVESSDLSEENNVLVLLEIKRKIERLAAKQRYRWAEDDDLRLFKENCKELFSTYEGTKCKSISIDVKSSAWEKIRYIVHVYLEVVFRAFQKRAIIEIDINPRA